MKVFEVIKSACYFTDNTPLADKLDAINSLNASLSGFEDDEKLLIKEFMRYYNLIQDELAYYSFNKVECESQTFHGRIELITLNPRPLKILSIRDDSGRKARYKKYKDYILVNAKKVTVEYLPITGFTDFNTVLDERISGRILSYGLAREYYLAKGLYEDAEIWENRFKDGIKIMLRREPCATIAKRRWL